MASESTAAKRHGSHSDDPSEASPLLEGACGFRDGIENKKVDKPFPTTQIILLCYARLMESVAFFAIFPYLPQMIQYNGDLPESRIGFYSGLVESASSIAEMTALPFWCYLSDQIGRKPALLCSLVGMAAGPMLFGFSSSIWQMILFRGLAGFFAGSGLIIRTMIGEQTTPEMQATAYGWFSMADSLGGFIGPLIGGGLADPAKQYPRVFGGIPFFETWRFALPGLAVSVINASGAFMSLFLKETMDKSQRSSDQEGQAQQDTSFFQLTKIPGLPFAFWVYGQSWLVVSFLISVLPVALFTQVALGGIGFSTSQISLYMGAQAASQTLWLLIAFPKIQRRLGTKRTFGLCAMTYPILFLSYIVMNAFLREGSQASIALFWIMVVLTAIVGPMVFMSFSASQLIINEACPDIRMIGSLNTVALMICNLTRIVAPGAATAIYAVGVKNQILQGYLGWTVFIMTALGLYVSHRWLPDRFNYAGIPIYAEILARIKNETR